jgi:hypothetical protein
MRLFLLAFFQLICGYGVLAQTEYEPAYFINRSGERIEGFIKNLDWKNNPDRFRFKTSLEAQAEAKMLPQVKEFGFKDGMKYIYAKVEIDRSSINLQSLDRNRNPKWSLEEVFLKVILEGKASLYVFRDGDLILYFFRKDNGSLKQLVHKFYIKSNSEEDGESYQKRAENNDFRQQLSTQLPNTCIKDSRSLMNLEYRKKELQEYFKRYNDCFSSVSTTYEYKREDLIRAKLLLGVNRSSLYVNIFTGDNNPDFSPQVALNVGFELEYRLPFNKNKWSIFIQPSYSNYSQEFENPNSIFSSRSTVSYNYIAVPMGFRYYQFLSSEHQIFIDAAYAGFNTFNSQLFTARRGFLDMKSTFTAQFGMSYQYKKWSFEFMYLLNRDLINSYTTFDSEFQNMSLTLGYRLF